MVKERCRQRILAEIEKRKEYLNRVPTTEGTYEENILKMEKIMKEAEIEEKFYKEELAVFNNFVTSRQHVINIEVDKLKKLEGITAQIDAKINQVVGEITNLQTKSDKIISDKQRQIEHLQKYELRLGDNIKEIKDKIESNDKYQNRIAGELKEKLKVETNKLYFCIGYFI